VYRTFRPHEQTGRREVMAAKSGRLNSASHRGCPHPRVGIEADRQEGTDVVLKVAHTGDDPVSAADVIDQPQLAERERLTHNRSMPWSLLCGQATKLSFV
jgi:hypothetical protein